MDKEVDAEILWLADYFSDAEDKEDEGHLDEVVEVMAHQVDGEEAAAKESQEDAKEIADGEVEKKMSDSRLPIPPPPALKIYLYLFFCFCFSYLFFLNIKTYLPIDKDLRLLGCNFEQLSFALICFKFLHLYLYESLLVFEC